VLALAGYGFVASFQPDPNFGRVLAAYGGIFVAGSLAWGVLVDRFRPDRYDLAGAAVCLLGAPSRRTPRAADRPVRPRAPADTSPGVRRMSSPAPRRAAPRRPASVA
jgi:hypothetical protein